MSLSSSSIKLRILLFINISCIRSSTGTSKSAIEQESSGLIEGRAYVHAYYDTLTDKHLILEHVVQSGKLGARFNKILGEFELVEGAVLVHTAWHTTVAVKQEHRTA